VLERGSRLLARQARRLEGLAARPPAEPGTLAAADDPPAQWVALVRDRAPQLLDGGGEWIVIGAPPPHAQGGPIAAAPTPNTDRQAPRRSQSDSAPSGPPWFRRYWRRPPSARTRAAVVRPAAGREHQATPAAPGAAEPEGLRPRPRPRLAGVASRVAASVGRARAPGSDRAREPVAPVPAWPRVGRLPARSRLPAGGSRRPAGARDQVTRSQPGTRAGHPEGAVAPGQPPRSASASGWPSPAPTRAPTLRPAPVAWPVEPGDPPSRPASQDQVPAPPARGRTAAPAAGGVGPAGPVPLPWPELPAGPEPEDLELRGAAVLQAWQRQQWLDAEQRGAPWSG
jgi:hypothetical protein